MYRILTASKDTYITNKIVKNSFRATDANVGMASTLDLYKLYGESTSGSVENPIEISRVLIKFNLDPLRALTGSILDLNSSTFKATLKLHDVYGGQTTPSNFKLIVFPLSKSFDEGIGRNIIDFSDLDSCNFITASVSNGSPDPWNTSGANQQGFLGASDIDIISSGTLSGSSSTENINLWKEQTFSTGEEDLSVDITTLVSGTLVGLIPDHGFRISFSGSQETDAETRFVKRFASRHTTNYTKKPSIIVHYDDSVQDHHEVFYFDMTGSLFLNNSARGARRNFISGAAGTAVEGSDCLHLRLISGSNLSGTLFQKTITGSQHKIGDNSITGVYSASFAISQFESGTLYHHVKSAGSASFTAIWSSLDETVPFLTSSLTIFRTDRSAFDNDPKRLLVSVTNVQPTYGLNDKVRFRVFVENIDREIVFTKTPMETKSQIFTKMYYRIRDAISSDIIIPFEKKNNSTLCSTDSDGMYFDLYMDTLREGRLYTIDFLIRDLGEDLLFTDVAAKFRLEK